MGDDNKITINISSPEDNYSTYITSGTSTIAPSFNIDDLNDTGSEYAVNTDYTYTTDGFDISMPGIEDSPDTWPAEYRVKEMIKKYPALKIQYEKFIEIYNLIKDDHKDDLDDILK